MNKNAGISTLKGIGEKTEKLFLKLGVATVDDLLHYYPRTYEIFGPPVPVSEVQEGHICTVSGAVFGRIQVSGTKNMQVTTLYLKRSDRNFKSDLVPYAFFKEYIRQERPGHFTWQSGS